MKNYINKSAKRILSLALAVIMLAGCLFTANLGSGITASAETDSNTDYSGWNIQYWDGVELKTYWDPEKDGEHKGKYVISTAAQLQFAAAATRNGSTSVSSLDKSFVIDEKVDAFIMQPESVVEALGGPATFIELSGAEETRVLFEETFAEKGKTPVNWVSSGNFIFHGNFDGSGVPVYGIYADGVSKNIENVGFFPAHRDESDTNGRSMEVKNLVIKNCYFKGWRRVSILTGRAWGDVDGYLGVDSCIFANCYLLGQNKKSDGSLVNYGTGEMGMIGGGMSAEPVIMSNTLIYGNKTKYDNYDANGNVTNENFDWIFRDNTNNGKYYGSVKNCIILDAVLDTKLTSDNNTYCQNIYSNTTTSVTAVTNMIDHASVMGAQGGYFMPALEWGSKWFAVENDYPTPIYREKEIYVDAVNTPFDGSGTEEDPYIIRSAKQLDQMIADGGWTDNGARRAYYKVADDVKAIYLNGDVTTKEQAVALYANNGGKFNNWNQGNNAKSFEGHFDGNGVTIYGMISSNRGDHGGNVGFFTKIGVTNNPTDHPDAVTTSDTTASISNVNFVGACIDSNSAAAVVASAVVGWRDTSADGTRYEDVDGSDETTANDDIKPNFYINNVTVRDSSISTIASNFSSDTATSHSGTAAGIFAVVSDTPDHVVISNCLYDGGSCVLNDGDTSASRTKTAKAGIVSNPSGGNELTIENCVSIGEPAIPMVVGIDYSNRYNSGAYDFITVYGEVPAGFDTTAYTKLATCYDIPANSDGTTKTSFVMSDMQMLNWGGAWNLTEYNGRSIPMPKLSSETVEGYSTQLLKLNNGRGLVQLDNTRSGGYTKGTYGMYEQFVGSGTKEDPYIISDALDLAIAIACGGKDITTALYYKLACDIDVSATWINMTNADGKYVYVPFEGHIDGDGHTIYNLYAISQYAALIPRIKGGASIKNLHIRDSYIAPTNKSDDSGVFFGQYYGDGKDGENKVIIEGCSFEGEAIDGGAQKFVSDFSASRITNSYVISGDYVKYLQFYETGSSSNKETMPTVSDADFYGEEGVTDPVWYQGADGKPKLVNRAKAMTEVDVAGDGKFDYDADDLTALKRKLLGDEDYKYIYGDVNRNGKTNLSDLALLGRQLVGAYNLTADGFWRNAALGNIVIYYGENDNYDFARKLELALEGEFGKDVKKVVVGTAAIGNITYGNKSDKNKLYVHKNDIYTDGTNYYKFSENLTTGEITPVQINDTAELAKYALDGKCQIVVGDVTGYTSSLGANNYSITADKKNSAIWLQGGSFTAVEQATLDFINNSNPDTNTLYEVADGTLGAKKKAITVDGKTYYYAWGDEFDGDTLNKDTWNYDGMHNETGNKSSNTFENLEVAFPEDMEKLYEMIDGGTDNGKLKIWRGYYGTYNSSYDWGYKNLTAKTGDNKFGGSVESDDIYVTAGKISTNKSMVAKQGYLEMKASYPLDGHAFVCWWLMGTRGYTNNTVLSDSLFGKIYKLNNIAAYNGGDTSYAYDGKSNGLDSRYPSTYKYQLPNSTYEIDIAELMQGGSNGNNMNYKTANYTIHKFYENGSYTNDSGNKAVKFIDWNYITTGQKSTNNAVADKHYTLSFTNGYKKSGSSSWSSTTLSSTINVSEFLLEKTLERSSGSDSRPEYGKYNGEMIHHEGDGTNPWFSSTVGTVSVTGGQEYIFGMKWEIVDNSDVIYTFTVHEANGDGTKGTLKTTVTVKDDIAYLEDSVGNNIATYLSKVSNIESDKDTANQYMYMLIDNTYYTSNLVDGGWLDDDYVEVYDNLLTQETTSEIATMEVDYVRVYQENDRRDIVTPDTEAFNNGNHFGY